MPRSGNPTRTRTVGDVKAHFAECLREAEAGHTIIVTRHGRAVARLEPVGSPRHAGVDRNVSEELAEPMASYSANQPRVQPSPEARRAALHALLVSEIWPRVPKELLGKGVTKKERED